MRKLGAFILAGAVLIGAQGIGYAKSCPSPKVVKDRVKELIPREFSVVEVKELSQVKGLCQAVIKVGIKPLVVYTDKKANYMIVGNLLDLKEKKNLTAEETQKHSKLDKKILDKLEKHVNIVYNDKAKKYIYFISDPDCPFCKKAEPILKEWADKNKVALKVILYPLPIHPQAKGKAVALICDNRKLEDVHNNYTSKNQCEKGIKAVEANMKFLGELGINGTPTLIGMNGNVVQGLPRSESELDSLID